LEGRPNFDAHKIIRVIESSISGLITRVESVASDHGD
jgi:hypothetical protein